MPEQNIKEWIECKFRETLENTPTMPFFRDSEYQKAILMDGYAMALGDVYKEIIGNVDALQDIIDEMKEKDNA